MSDYTIANGRIHTLSQIQSASTNITYQEVMDMIKYMEYISELLNTQLPNFEQFRDMSELDRNALLRDIKINNILD